MGSSLTTQLLMGPGQPESQTEIRSRKGSAPVCPAESCASLWQTGILRIKLSSLPGSQTLLNPDTPLPLVLGSSLIAVVAADGCLPCDIRMWMWMCGCTAVSVETSGGCPLSPNYSLLLFSSKVTHWTETHGLTCPAGQPALGPLSLPSSSGVPVHVLKSGFNTGPHSCTASTFLTGNPPQPLRPNSAPFSCLIFILAELSQARWCLLERGCLRLCETGPPHCTMREWGLNITS